MKILNASQNTVIARNAQQADTAISRLVGLLGRDGLASGEALVITRCRSIHMFFMRFAIDVIFINKSGVVVGLVEGIKPFRMSPYFMSSSYVIELPVGVISTSKSSLGDAIELQEK